MKTKKTLTKRLTGLAAVLCAAVLGCGTVLAYSPSAEVENQTTVENAVVVIDGQEVSLTVSVVLTPANKVTEDSTMTAAEKETFDKALVAVQDSTLNVLAFADLHLYGEVTEAQKAAIKSNGVVVTLSMNGLDKTMNYEYRHCAEGCDPDDVSTWEKGTATVSADGKSVSFKLYSFSPVAIVSTGKKSGTTSDVPATGALSEMNTPAYLLWAVVGGCVVAAGVIYLVAAKRKKQSR